ncbi:hypothetical protein [uncultured Treponema sp.]|nr:hypothetical protein [uncultured Treponema sp.]
MKKLEIKDYNRKIKMIYKGECRVFEKTAYKLNKVAIAVLGNAMFA